MKTKATETTRSALGYLAIQLHEIRDEVLSVEARMRLGGSEVEIAERLEAIVNDLRTVVETVTD